ncbi:hypothetical protein JAAARDRAFT_565027 [Jaapia argillacea MUCL 33604]|uniref:Nucleolus and neural progenitor protein-like N-terminal domain-containing protein n=1 Tax=Jaapia argillacea MUCL 33604 TaxID=933084 RepID=A0A067Q407_9AGAM|nr:hypothetical protein JAAARDRAFT_565027 [Jaapia argillacea MUCL 33604]
MKLRRYAQVSSISCCRRSSLDASLLTSVDSALKDLKGCCRQLQTLLSVHADEVQVLERLHYKGKNQHRSAIFWNRADEMRRFGLRLKEMNLGNLLDVLRSSFFGDTLLTNPKSLRGSWTHYPSAKYLKFVLERLSAGHPLLERNEERLNEAYHYFTLAMQSGYFAQLILTLTAISSRLSLLINEIHKALKSAHRVVHEMLTILHPGEAQKCTHLLNTRINDAHDHRAPVIVPIIAQEPPSSSFVGEDLGTSVARPAAHQVLDPSEKDTRNLTEPAVHRTYTRSHAPSPDDLFSIMSAKSQGSVAETPVLQEQSASTSTVVSKTCEAPGLAEVSLHRENIVRTNNASLKKRKHSRGAAPSEVKKRMKRKDEIDEIFGF